MPHTRTAAYAGGEGSPVVLLHGAAATWQVWKRVVPLLEPHHRVFAPTLPGHLGALPLPAGTKASVPALADALERQLDAEGLETAHLVGNSLGGWLALELAQRGRARSVVALSPAGGWTSAADARALGLKFRIGYRGAKVIGRRAKYVTRVPGVRQAMIRPVARYTEDFRPWEAAELFKAAAGCAVLPELLRSTALTGGITPMTITCPVRIVWSEEDRVLPYEKFGRSFLTNVPSGVHLTIPRAGHVPMLDQPRLVSEIILDLTRGSA